MARALSALSAKSSSLFQRKRIPEFAAPEKTAPERTPVIAWNELPRIVITPADDILYSSSASSDSGSSPATFDSVAESRMDSRSMSNTETTVSQDPYLEDDWSSVVSSKPSNAPTTPSYDSHDFPFFPDVMGIVDGEAEIGSTSNQSLDTLETNEIHVMLQQKNRDDGFVDRYRACEQHRQLVDSPDHAGTETINHHSDQLVSTIDVASTFSTVQQIILPSFT
ncbi:hypothetical protein M408DRAFT_330695 [Serendipita vermifera MAFF 305830]|uniref:Uncharacterized protein n=1 Tax=Serendipita vermifera MAFF 305830 TaxID=933852 RepID=A0A0C2XAX0_SERVB|nr:hypothetical protein M408DRAFT_330695 [Serendipita vermifera MAFF 305830]